MAANPKRKYTLEEYFDLELSTNERFEYFDGEIFSMSGVSEQHAQIEGNGYHALRLALEGRECRVFMANMRIKVPSLPPYRYADVSATCEKPVFEKIGGVDVVTNPTLIIEVLSDSTEAYDRGDKFTHYKSIPSLKEYLLIAQHRPHITQYVKQYDGSWSYDEVNDLTGKIQLASIDCVLELSEIYRDVTFPENPSPNLREHGEQA
ncbi:MAG TPA: Uma2 family endonuclease [Blastocatellia bacterium]|nr:Uma2 family endonuclease [Blastocatellia bacterium]